jgi:hypothetical protein
LPKIIELPDGTEAEFPDNMPDSQIEAVLRREYGGGDRTPSVGDALVGAAQNVDPGSAVGRFASGLWQNINPVTMVKGLAQVVSSPIETGKAVVGQMGEQWEKAYHAGAEGRYSEMVGHGVAGSLPLIGPAAAAAGERIGSGDVAGGLGEGVGNRNARVSPEQFQACPAG